jgi:hypothetical protein
VIAVGTRPSEDSADYEIVLGKRLGSRGAASFSGFELIELPGDGVLLRGRVADQAALHGVLAQVRDLGIPLVSVRRAAVNGSPPADEVPSDVPGG